MHTLSGQSRYKNDGDSLIAYVKTFVKAYRSAVT